MKLELKHLAGYLPYGLRIKNKTTNMLLTGAYLDELNDPLFGFYDSYKPILHPLSDLTKDENFDSYMDLCEELGVVQCEHLLIALQGNLRYAFNLQNFNALEGFMFKNHYDWKYNLIEKGLAIDINTLD